jgi:hypothetical protein
MDAMPVRGRILLDSAFEGRAQSGSYVVVVYDIRLPPYLIEQLTLINGGGACEMSSRAMTLTGA